MRAAASALIMLLTGGAGAAAQAPPPGDTANGWNSKAALELMARSRLRREQPRGDTALRNYSAQATGHVYFYLDRPESEENTLVKVDQIALEIYWAAPNLTKQKIVGLRDVSRLPNRMYYHLDHLTVVQNGFSDIIRIGDGDEVRDVPHPAAEGSDSIYDFRIAGSQTLTFAGQPPVRVFEVQTRPRRADRSALIGSIFIDQESADLVRLSFTFTPASYVDRRLDYINITLDNGLWSGRYWLPNEQYVEIRRQLPELDFAAGAVITGRLRVYDYEFNLDLPRNFFYGRPIDALPEEERKAFPFTEGIYEGLDREGLAPPPQVEALRAQAIALMRQRKLSGLPPLRLHIPNVSSVLRYNRGEGIFLGMGAAYVPNGPVRFEALGGYAFGAQKPGLSLGARYTTESPVKLAARGFLNDPRDLGWRVTVPGAINTLGAFALHEDYADPFYASGAELTMERPVRLTWTMNARAAAERHTSIARNANDEDFRPLLPITEGLLASLRVGLEGPLFQRDRLEVRADVSAEAGTLDSRNYLRPIAGVAATLQTADRASSVLLGVSGGTLLGDDVVQKRFAFGGVRTLPGYDYRVARGDAFWLVEAEVARDVFAPWIRARLLGAVGGTSSITAATPTSASFNGLSYGVGVGLFWDILRLDVVRGGSHDPRLYFSVKPDFWDMF